MAVTHAGGLTVRAAFGGEVTRVTLARKEAGNTLDAQLVYELRENIDAAVRAGSRVLVLDAEGERFCSGMDLAAASDHPENTDGARFWDLLTAMRTSPLLVVAAVDGAATGGGVGLVAAADIVIATPRSSFALPEALWGLLPCCVVPFLAERAGLALARRMTLLTTPIDASVAASAGLVDDVVSDLDAAVRQLALRLRRVAPETVAAAKDYFRDLPTTRAAAREHALTELDRLLRSELVTGNLTRFASHGTYPWETR